MFSDSVDGNCEILKELIGGIPPSQRNKAKRAAMKIEKAFTDLQRDHPKDAAVALGAAFAIYLIGQRIVEQAKESDGKGLIQLLS
jgi:predicted nuclease with RNAse H fold